MQTQLSAIHNYIQSTSSMYSPLRGRYVDGQLISEDCWYADESSIFNKS
jgi:hypothetical protein